MFLLTADQEIHTTGSMFVKILKPFASVKMYNVLRVPPKHAAS